jgi:hypothetical protein
LVKGDAILGCLGAMSCLIVQVAFVEPSSLYFKDSQQGIKLLGIFKVGLLTPDVKQYMKAVIPYLIVVDIISV